MKDEDQSARQSSFVYVNIIEGYIFGDRNPNATVGDVIRRSFVERNLIHPVEEMVCSDQTTMSCLSNHDLLSRTH